MHHPPSWLSPKARDDFRGSIYLPERFALCLHGHLHEARSQGISEAGGGFRYFFQAPSLFGLEHYGTARARHAFGYAWGRISETGEVRLWPRVRTVHGDGTGSFVHDTYFRGGNETDGVELRPADRGSAPAQADGALETYRQWAGKRHRGLPMIGVGGGELRLRLDEVYATSGRSMPSSAVTWCVCGSGRPSGLCRSIRNATPGRPPRA